MGLQPQGVLVDHGAGLAEHLRERGYAPRSVSAHLRLLAHLDEWLVGQGLAAEELAEATVDRYLAARRAGGQRLYVSRRGVATLLDYLGTVAPVPPAAPPTASTLVGRVLASYRHHLADERKLAPGTVDDYEYYGGIFLSQLRAPVRADLSELRAADVVGAMRSQCEARSRSWTKNFTAALRSLLRLLFLEGWVHSDLTGCVLPVSGWRHRRLPQALGADDVVRLLSSCDRQALTRRRDLAIMTLALRLGLRACEVANLQLDDVDWRAGEVSVSGKGGRHDRLPLPVDVGETVTDYLCHERPPTSSRSLFIKAVAPRVGISSKTVEGVVQRASRRAGLGPVGPHRLRHTAATGMLRAGASLPEIGQVLRHQHAQTTARYARVDFGSLAALAMPWPEVTA